MIGVCVHWFYGPHTTDGVVGKDNPLLLASNFSGQWPGLVGLLNTGACLESLAANILARVDRRAGLDRGRDVHGPARASGARPAASPTPRSGDCATTRPSPKSAAAGARRSPTRSERRRVLILMLGDTSMGMINGYFGPRLLNSSRLHRAQGRPGLDHRPRPAASSAERIDDALAFVKDKGVTFHWGEDGAEDFDENATREQLRDYLAVLDLVERVQGRLRGLAVPARLVAAAAAVGFRRRAAQLGLPAGVATATRSSPPPRPTRATSSPWS